MAWVEKRGNRWRVRYQREDGTLGSVNGFTSKSAASDRAQEIEADQRRHTFLDPSAGRITLAEWVTIWQEGHHTSASTRATYNSHLRTHILPRYGQTEVGKITRLGVKAWAKQLREGLSERSVIDVVRLLSTLLNEAVEERRIPANPCRGLRLKTGHTPERPFATPAQVLEIAERTTSWDFALIITAAYTGMRWGELAGLRRPNCRLDTNTIHVAAKDGALHEVAGKLWLGPPKTGSGIRDIALPDFLVDLLKTHLDTHDHDHVFISHEQTLLRRSGFRPRVWLPAVNGNNKEGTGPVVPGMHFHDLRHTHKTWLIEDGVPEIAQAQRLGHKLTGVAGIYSHTTSVVIQRLVNGLQQRWEHTTGEYLTVSEAQSSQFPPTSEKQTTSEGHEKAA